MADREEFLRTWYQVLWSNIDRSMMSVWQITGLIVVVGGAFIYRDKLGPNLTVSLQMIVIFWAINNTIDMNSWHRRNLLFIFRVEQQFLNDTDYGRVIPSSYRGDPPTRWIAFYKINFATFVVLLVAVIAEYVHVLIKTPPANPCLAIGPLLVFLAGAAFTGVMCSKAEERIARTKREISEGR